MIRSQMEIAQEWFQFVDQYWWCPKGVQNRPDLSPSVEIVLEMLENAWDLGDPDRAWSEIERISNNLQMSNIEKSVATKLCGQILLAMQNREGTEHLIRTSLISMPRSQKHFVAVLTWMMGIIHWLRPGKHTNAINEWKESISLFFDISRDPATGMSKKNWYSIQLNIMRDALRKAIRDDQLPPLGGVQGVGVTIPVPRAFGGRRRKDLEELEEDLDFGSGPELDLEPDAGLPAETPEKPLTKPEQKEQAELPAPPAEPPPKQKSKSSQPEAPPKEAEKPKEEPKKNPPKKEQKEPVRDIRKLPLPDLPDEDDGGLIPIDEDILPPGISPISPVVQDFLNIVRVFDQISAGPPVPIPDASTGLPPIEIPLLRIGEQYYNVHYIGKKTSRRIINIFDKDYYFLKINGSSMNAAGIDDGDYVVIRYQTHAQNEDIVAAVIGEETEAEATLKRYVTGKKLGPDNGKNKIVLKAESRDPEFRNKKWEFSPELQNQEEGFSIRGVAVAVLKPVEF